MKRALIVLLLLAVAGGLFAQSVVFSGGAKSGLQVAIEDDTTLHVYEPDMDGGYRLQLGVAATTRSGNAGATGRVVQNLDGATVALDADTGVSSGVIFDNAYAWLKPLDILTLYGGKVDAGGFSTGAVIDESNGVIDGVGASLGVDVIPGLGVGLSIAPNGGELGDAAYSLGAKFDATGLLGAVATLKYDGAGNAGDGATNVGFGVSVSALENLGVSLGLELLAENLTKLKDAGAVTGGLIVGFNAGALSAGVKGLVYAPVQDNQALDLAGSVYGAFGLTNAVTLNLGVGYSLKETLEKTNGSTFDYRAGWDGLPKGNLSDKVDSSVLGIQPSVTFAIGGGTLDLGYGLLTHVGGDSLTKHSIYTVFNVEF